MSKNSVFTNHLKCGEVTVKKIFKKKRSPNTGNESKTLKCPICHNLFKEELIFKSHMRKKHAKLKPLKCNRCDEVFKTEVELQWHLSLHTEDIKCNKCDQVFKELISLREHYKDHSKLNDKGQEVWECRKCYAVFISVEYRDNHERKYCSKHSSKERKMWREKFLLF